MQILKNYLNAHEIARYELSKNKVKNFDYPEFDQEFVMEMIDRGFDIKKYNASSIPDFIEKWQPIFDYIVDMISLVCMGEPIFQEYPFDKIISFNQFKKGLKFVKPEWTWDSGNVKSWDMSDSDKILVYYLRAAVEYKNIDIDSTIKNNIVTYLVKKEIVLKQNQSITITHIGEYLEDLVGEPNFNNIVKIKK